MTFTIRSAGAWWKRTWDWLEDRRHLNEVLQETSLEFCLIQEIHVSAFTELWGNGSQLAPSLVRSVDVDANAS